MYKTIYVALLLAACNQTDAKPRQTLQPEAPAVEAAPSVDGPASIQIDPLTVSTAAADIEKGKGLFAAKGCVACHKTDTTRLVGPGLQGVTARRTIPWMQRMILKPEVMVKDDPTAKQLLGTYFTPMPAQGVDPKAELPLLIAYLKSLEK